MVWPRRGDKPLSEPMMVSLLTHICVTRPQRVNLLVYVVFMLTNLNKSFRELHKQTIKIEDYVQGSFCECAQPMRDAHRLGAFTKWSLYVSPNHVMNNSHLPWERKVHKHNMNHNNLPHGMMINSLKPKKSDNSGSTCWGLIKNIMTLCRHFKINFCNVKLFKFFI